MIKEAFTQARLKWQNEFKMTPAEVGCFLKCIVHVKHIISLRFPHLNRFEADVDLIRMLTSPYQSPVLAPLIKSIVLVRLPLIKPTFEVVIQFNPALGMGSLGTPVELEEDEIPQVPPMATIKYLDFWALYPTVTSTCVHSSEDGWCPKCESSKGQSLFVGKGLKEGPMAGSAAVN